MANRDRDPYSSDTDFIEDMTEETLAAQEQERQQRQHQQEHQRARLADEDATYFDQDDLEDLQ
ncbi:hypothetical protein ACFOSC_10000 [Streptantibioticus rubrisoli]|uniref:Uncharacterized protein n=1 Tax=Streptantibioticus rubrisoli TaxID=1387313 RepID=A0ABT1P6P2_9ACTN|nr:hypothetical protein [Streptantibioticus rubrisoli]MCQ4041037.1 hypothetical protein [Streptantibioticus rubrisoli]